MMNDKVADIVKFKELVDADETNDFYLFQFIAKVLELSGEQGVLTDIGFRILQNNLPDDLAIINEEHKKDFPSQKPILRAVLYLTIAFNIALLYGGFVSISLKDTPLLKELKEYLVKIEQRSSKLIPILEGHLSKLVGGLTDKYAKSFDTIKRSCFTKDLFNSVDRIPPHPNDIPKGFKYEDAIELPAS
mgnify:CR=1 FL=1